MTDFDLESTISQSKVRLKLVLYRPHTSIWFRNKLSMILRNQSLPNKYAQLFDYLLNSHEDLYLASSIVPGAGFASLFHRLADRLHLVLWCIFNRIDLRKVRFVSTKKALSSKDVIFFMHYGNFTFESDAVARDGLVLAQQLADIKIRKVVHMTHFAYNTVVGAHNLDQLNPDLLVAENNLSKNSLFFKYFFSKLTSEFFCLPYLPSPRFQHFRNFTDRTHKLVVTGSITYRMKDREFIDFFAVDELQPLRRKLYERASEFRNEMVCLISDLNATRAVSSHSFSDRIQTLLRRIFGKHGQQNYYKTNIVDTYNTYSMFAVPEEICDLPAIGFVEGMACGAAYFGIENAMYQDLGMIPDVHYISYNGSVEHLMEKVRYFQNRLDLVQKIADEGRRFVTSKLTADHVYGAFVEHLREMVARQPNN